MTDNKSAMVRIFNRNVLIEMIALGFFAFVIRLFYVFMIIGRYGTSQYSDFLYMQQLAESLAKGNGFTIAGQWVFSQSVGYPAFMSIFYKLITPKVSLAIAVNILLGATSVVLLYIFCLYLFKGYSYKEFSFGKEGAIIRLACVLAALYPDSLLYCSLFASENLLIPLFLLLLIFLVINYKRDWIGGLLVGFIAAAAASVKAYVIFFYPFIPLIWWIRKRRFFVSTIAAVLTGIICLIPWTYINYRVSKGKFVPFSATFGSAFLDGTNPKAVGKPTNDYYFSPDFESKHDEVELNNLRMKKAISYIKENPGWYCKLLFKKFLHSLSPARDFLYQEKGQNRLFTLFLSRWFPSLFNTILLAGLLLGLIVSYRNKYIFILGISIFTTPLILQLVFFAYSRYRFPFLFSLLPFCALGFLSFTGRNFFCRK